MNFIPSKFYQEQYQQSINNPDEFWAKQALQLSWFKKPLIAKNTSFDPQVKIKWFEDGELNACYNCVDRHVEAGRGQDIAIIWQGDDPTKSKKVSYLQLQEQV
ncbi:MAG: hypothetical protein RL769_349, partial [Pseudomonadota bacterium]